MTKDEKGAQEINPAVLPFLKRCFGLNKELNSPVAGIVGYCEFLLDSQESLSTGQKLSIEEIRDFAIKIQRTLEELAAEKTTLSNKVDAKVLESEDAPATDSTAID